MGPPIPPNGAHIGHTMGGVPSEVKVHMTVYLDYTCPFSAKSYFMLFNQVAPHYGDKVAITFYHQVQPWHPQSSYCHEAALAVAHLNGNDAFFKFSNVLMRSLEEYYDYNTYDLTRRQIYDKLGDLAQSVGVDKAKFMDLLALDAESIAKGSNNPGNQMTQNLKWEIKASRTMGMHVSPTTTINGIVYDSSSGWTLDQWTELLDPLLA